MEKTEPRRAKREEEGRKSLLALLLSRLGLSSGGGGVLGEGLIPALSNFLAGHTALAFLVALISGASVYGVYTLSSSPKPAATEGGAVFARSPGASSAEEDEEGSRVSRRVGDSIGYFSTANKGSLGDSESSSEENGEAPGEDGSSTPPPGQDIAEQHSGAHAEKPKMVASAFGKSSQLGGAMAGGAGLSGGLMSSFLPRTPAGGGAQGALKSPAKAVASRGLKAARSQRRVGKQLAMAADMSRKGARSASVETARQYGTDAFEAQSPGAALGEPIGGGAVGTGGAGVEPGASPAESVKESPQEAPEPDKGENKSDWQKKLLMARMLLMAASGLILISGFMAQNPQMKMIAKILSGVAAGMAAMAAYLGYQIMTVHGQVAQGKILVAGGGITAAAAVASMLAPPQIAPWLAVLAGVAGMAASVASMMTQSKVPSKNSDLETSDTQR